ncbi:MAG TPA: SIMPL domain-containing protein, partial [Anaerolineales bacterium]|nr:SIMPL domain-containing protein [Anaerolineales bacterium]
MKNKSLFITALFVLALLVSACAPVAANPAAAVPQRTITVAGTGTAYLTPDIAYLYLGVHTEKLTAAEAVAENNDQTQTVIQALQDFGIAANDIRTTNFSIWPIDKYDPATGLPSGEKSYAVDNTVYVTVRDLETLGDLLDTVVQAGANTVNSIQFDVADRDEALKDARAEAVQDAGEKAAELAAAAGVELGELQSVSFPDLQNYPIFDGRGGGGAAAEQGTSRMSALPATGETMPLILAATSDTTLSNASGPSRIAPLIWPRSAILHSAAASSVPGIFGLTVSTAERIATFGSSIPSRCASSIAFWQMSTFASRSGRMLMAASVTSSSRGYVGTSMMKTCE